MKKTLLSLSILFSLGASAQLTQANHAPTVGFNYDLFQCDTAGVTSGATGAAATWNYTSLNTTTVAVANYSTIASSNAAYSSADVSVTASTSDVAYFKSSGTDLKYYGGDLNFGLVSGTINYSNPAIYAKYPMALNTTTTSTPSGSVTVFGSTGPIGGTVTVIADGAGTLNLDAPGAAAGTTLKSFTDVIRVKTIENLLGNVTITFPFTIAVTFTVTRENYDFYSPSASKAPILSIANFTANLNSVSGPTVNTVKNVTVQRDYNIVGINEVQKSSIELTVYPNPAATVVNFATTSPEATKVIAFDVTGKLVATELLEMGKAKMNLINLSSGMYIYHVVDKNNLVLKSDKFNVSK
jgi:hypothetical protein